jgi:dihydroflavonol-4-reductase
VGANLVPELLRLGRRVRVLVHENDHFLEGFDVERVPGDVLDPGSLRSALEGADVLYHLAAIISITGDRDGRVRAVNVDGVANVTEAALQCGVRRMVHFSSIHAYTQEPLDQPLDETRAKVSDPGYPAYDRSKAAGEERVRAAIERGLDAVIVNPTGIIGPNDFEPSRMGRTFLDHYHGRLPALVPGGFNFVDVRDVVAGALAAEQRGRTGENYLLSGHWLSVPELCELYQQVTGRPGPRIELPMWLVRLGTPAVELWGRIQGQEPLYTAESLHALGGNRDMRHDKATRELGYQPRPTLESVQAIYDSFRKSDLLASP